MMLHESVALKSSQIFERKSCTSQMSGSGSYTFIQSKDMNRNAEGGDEAKQQDQTRKKDEKPIFAENREIIMNSASIVADSTSIQNSSSESLEIEGFTELNKYENFESLQSFYLKDLKLNNIQIMKIMYGLIRAIEKLRINDQISINLDPKNILIDQNMHVHLFNADNNDDSNSCLPSESPYYGNPNMNSDVYSYGKIIKELLEKYDVLTEERLHEHIIHRFQEMIEECLTLDLNKRLTLNRVIEFFEAGNTIIDENLDFSYYICEEAIDHFDNESVNIENLEKYIRQGKYYIAYHLSVIGSHVTNNSNFKFYLGILNLRGFGTICNLKKAFEYFKAASNENIVNSYLYLGLCYQCGYGTDKNDNEAFKCYEYAAEQGNCSGKIRLSLLYMKGFGVEKDTTKALKILNELVSEGYSPAYFYIGKYYYNIQNYEEAIKYFNSEINLENDKCAFYMSKIYELGYGVDKEEKISTKYLKVACKKNCLKALIDLCYRYHFGHEDEQNDDKATKYFNKTINVLIKSYNAEIINAFSNKCDPIQHCIGYYLKKLIQIIADLIRLLDQKEKIDINRILKLYQSYYDLNDKERLFQIGKIYFYLPDGDIDQKKADWYFHKSLDDSNPESYYYLGLYYKRTEYYKKHFYYINKAFELNYQKAFKIVINSYLNGIGVAKDIEKGIEIIEIGIELGFGECYSCKAFLYLDGIGKPKNPFKAFKYFSLAVKYKDYYALRQLSMFYLYGPVVEIDKKKSI